MDFEIYYIFANSSPKQNKNSSLKFSKSLDTQEAPRPQGYKGIEVKGIVGINPNVKLRS